VHSCDCITFHSSAGQQLYRVKKFLYLHDPDKNLPIYVATDNEALVKGREEICCRRTYLFASNFAEVLRSHSLEHFLERDHDYVVCSVATEVSTSFNSSFGSYIENFIGSGNDKKSRVAL